MAYPNFYFFPTTSNPATQREWQGMMLPTVEDGVTALSEAERSFIESSTGMFKVVAANTSQLAISSGVAWVSGYLVVSKVPEGVDLDWSTIPSGSSRVDLVVLTLNLNGSNECSFQIRMGSSFGPPQPVKTVSAEYDYPLASVTLSVDSSGVKSVTVTDLRVVATAIGGVHRGPIYQRPDDETTVGIGEMWYVTEPKAQQGLYIFDDLQGSISTPEWRAITSSQIVTSAQGTGFNPSQSTIQAGSSVVQTNSDGVFHVPFPNPFPNDIISVVMTNSDAQRGIMAGSYYVMLNKYPTGFTGMSVRYQITHNETYPNDPKYFTVDPYAFPLNAPVSVDYIAVGW